MYLHVNSSVPTWLTGVRCKGNEISLLQCSHNPIGSQRCDKDVGVVCQAPTQNTVEGESRLYSVCINWVYSNHGLCDKEFQMALPLDVS